MNQLKKDATKDFIEDTKASALEKKAQAKLETFSGNDIGFVSRDSVKSLAGLNEAKTAEFLSHVFDNNVKKGYKIIDGKAIVYEVLEQKLLNQDKAKQYVSLISENVSQMKQTELNQNLIKKLATAYKVEQYYKRKIVEHYDFQVSTSVQPKICAIIAQKGDDGEVKILGAGIAKSQVSKKVLLPTLTLLQNRFVTH